MRHCVLEEESSDTPCQARDPYRPHLPDPVPVLTGGERGVECLSYGGNVVADHESREDGRGVGYRGEAHVCCFEGGDGGLDVVRDEVEGNDYSDTADLGC